MKKNNRQNHIMDRKSLMNECEKHNKILNREDNRFTQGILDLFDAGYIDLTKAVETVRNSLRLHSPNPDPAPKTGVTCIG